jgi:hypothetical protein
LFFDHTNFDVMSGGGNIIHARTLVIMLPFWALVHRFLFDSRQFQGCKSNSIFHTDMLYKLSSLEYGRDDLGVYHMKKGTIEHHVIDPKMADTNCRKCASWSTNTDEEKGEHDLWSAEGSMFSYVWFWILWPFIVMNMLLK